VRYALSVESPPRPRLVLALLGVPALTVAVVITFLLRKVVPGSLAFSASILGFAVAARVFASRQLGDRALSLTAVASAGCAPFVFFCSQRALTVPTYDSSPLEGIGSLILGIIAFFLLFAGPLFAFVCALPLGARAGRTSSAVVRALAGVAVAVAMALTVAGALRSARYPDPDGYVSHLPIVPRTEGDTCPSERCVRCPSGQGARGVFLVTGAGAREIGQVEGPCDKLVFRTDAARGLLLVEGDVRHFRDRVPSPEVNTFAEAPGAKTSPRVEDLAATLAPPRGWVLEGALGLLLALASLFVPRLGGAKEEGSSHARATARAALAFAVAVLFATPLAAAWGVGLLR
jgi:hypothetical protein